MTEQNKSHFDFTKPIVLIGLSFALSACVMDDPYVEYHPYTPEVIVSRSYLIDVSQGSKRSSTAKSLSDGGLELSDGTHVRFKKWYTPTVIPEINARFLTEITPSFGATWGLSTGEYGEKYKINSGVWVGAVYRHDLTPRASLSFTAATLLGGTMRESSCVGDFGEIGGVQEVNCRLSATFLPPAETLQYLIKKQGHTETALSLRYQYSF